MSGQLTVAMVDDFLRGILLKDLRTQCRARGLNPGGSRETLYDRLKDNMLSTGDLTMYQSEEGGFVVQPGASPAKQGQNVGNFITDRSSSRVLAPPGGKTSIFMGDDNATANVPRSSNQSSPGAGAPTGATIPQDLTLGVSSDAEALKNNYTRSEGQNTGNFITDRSSSRVLAPPGGKTSIFMG